MSTPKYQPIGPSQYRAWWGERYLDVELNRERSYPGLGLGEVHACMYEEVIEAWRDEDIAIVLDAGCGSGYGTALLRNAGWIASGVDVSPTAVAFASQTYGPHFRTACLTGLPQADGSACAVVAVESIEHVEDDARAMAEFRRVMRPGGLLYLTTPEARPDRNVSPYHVREYTEAELRDLVEGAGFADVRIALGKHDFPETFRLYARKP